MHRKRCILLIEISVFIALLAVNITDIFFIIADKDFGKAELFSTFSDYKDITSLGFALTTMLACRHIHLHSLPVERLGIRTNSTIMKLYVICWVALALISVPMFILECFEAKFNEEEHYKSAKNERVRISLHALFCI